MLGKMFAITLSACQILNFPLFLMYTTLKKGAMKTKLEAVTTYT